MPTTILSTDHVANGYEVSRLLTAAVINEKFRKLLLSDPAHALAAGYNGEAFQLVPEEKERILTIHARDLADFAWQLSGIPVTVPAQKSRFYHDSRAALTIGMD